MEQRTPAASFRFVLFNMWSTEDRFASPVLNLWFTGCPPHASYFWRQSRAPSARS